MCLFLSVFITSCHSSAETRLSDSDVCLFFSGCPWLWILKGCHTYKKRGGTAWLQICIVLCPKGPPMFNNHPTAPPLSFLPSFLVDPRPAKLAGYHGDGVFLCDTGSKNLGKESNEHTVTYLRPWKTPCDGREILGDRGSGYRTLSRRPMTEYLETLKTQGHMKQQLLLQRTHNCLNIHKT